MKSDKVRVSARRERSQRGSNVLEFALVAPAMIVVMTSVITIGMNLARRVQTEQLSRDAASMFVRSVDFSKAGNQDILVRLGSALRMTRTGGDGVVILSKVTWVSSATCTALSLSPCNRDSHVVTQRIVVGNATIRASALGTPSGHLIDGSGLVRDYMKESSAVARMPTGLMLAEGQYAYVAETFCRGIMGSNPVYSRAIF